MVNCSSEADSILGISLPRCAHHLFLVTTCVVYIKHCIVDTMFRTVATVARRVVPTTARRVALGRAVVRPMVCNVRWASTDEDAEKKIREIDAKVVEAEAAMVEDTPLPRRVSGRAGAFAAGLYRDSVKSGGFASNCQQLNDFANALAQIDPFARRVFESTSYAPEDCWEGLFVLIGEGKLGSFKSLSDVAQEVIVADEVNMKKFEEARKAFSGVKIGEDVGRFLGTLCEAGRLDLFNKARKEYFSLVKAAGNGVDVRVVSAVELSNAQVKKVENILPQFLDGATPITSFEVDPTVLGGVQIQVGNTVAEATSDAVLRQVCQNFE